MEISEQIKMLRIAKKWTQTELGQLLGVSAQAVSKWETGIAVPDVGLLVPLARLFGTSVDALLTGDLWDSSRVPDIDVDTLGDASANDFGRDGVKAIADRMKEPESANTCYCRECHQAYPATMAHCRECHANYPTTKQHCCDCHMNYEANEQHCIECHTNYTLDQQHCIECHTNYTLDQQHCIECHTNYTLDQQHCIECHATYGSNVKHCTECHENYESEACPCCADENPLDWDEAAGAVSPEDGRFRMLRVNGGVHIRYGKNKIFIRRERID